MNLETYFAALDPGDITERLTAADGTVVTVQHYRNARGQRDGHAWACAICPTFGTSGEWSAWNEYYFTAHPEQYDRIDHGGTLREARHGAKWHTRGQHGGITDWTAAILGGPDQAGGLVVDHTDGAGNPVPPVPHGARPIERACPACGGVDVLHISTRVFSPVSAEALPPGAQPSGKSHIAIDLECRGCGAFAPGDAEPDGRHVTFDLSWMVTS